MTSERDAAHVLLDLMTAYSEDASEAVNRVATQTAFARLNEVDAVTLTRDDETDEMHLNVTPLLTATGFLMRVLLLHTAETAGKDPLDVVAILRRSVDESLGG